MIREGSDVEYHIASIFFDQGVGYAELEILLAHDSGTDSIYLTTNNIGSPTSTINPYGSNFNALFTLFVTFAYINFALNNEAWESVNDGTLTAYLLWNSDYNHFLRDVNIEK